MSGSACVSAAPTPWTEAQRREKRREYDRLYKSGCASGVRVTDARILIPENIERVAVSEPCFMCGTARGLCRHRVAG